MKTAKLTILLAIVAMSGCDAVVSISEPAHTALLELAAEGRNIVVRIPTIHIGPIGTTNDTD